MHPFHSLDFYMTGVPGDIAPGHPLWGHSLAGRSAEFAGKTDAGNDNWTIGDYFLAARMFVSSPQVLAGIEKTLEPGGASPGDWDIVLDLQKHGAFYHPIKMSVSVPGSAGGQSFVLNGGVSSHGRALSQKEACFFSWLKDRLPDPVTPEVVAAGQVKTTAGAAGFFMARWLEGYYEFHITRGRDRVAVWRPGKDTWYLSLADALPAYENIARILTLAYEPDSGDQVLLWHHAAGDFIMAPDQSGLPVKLITVRACASLVEDALLANGSMPGLLFFFVNLCLRMQIDRFDGVGDPVFLGDQVLRATLRGFLSGVAYRAGELETQTVHGIWKFFSGFSAQQLELILDQVIDAWPPGPLERKLIFSEKSVLAGQIQEIFKYGRVCDFY
jgi:hypothetical protein